MSEHAQRSGDDLPITDFFDPSPLLNHRDFRTRVGLRLLPSGTDPHEVRSWLGGRPQMPADQPWPEGPSGKMAFVTQICCADLPRELWGGIGPRDGWLLVFLDALPIGGEPYSRIIHVSERGPARHEGSDIELSFAADKSRSSSPAAGPVFPYLLIELVELPQNETAKHTMGGLPETGWHDPDHMTVSAYAPPALRQAWAKEYSYLDMDPLAGPEVLLFELDSDEVANWIWGDLDHAIIRMPRADLEQNRYDRAVLTTTGG